MAANSIAKKTKKQVYPAPLFVVQQPCLGGLENRLAPCKVSLS